MEILTFDEKIELLKLAITIGTYDAEINTLELTLKNYKELVAAISD
jgi:hypothetical protein